MYERLDPPESVKFLRVDEKRLVAGNVELLQVLRHQGRQGHLAQKIARHVQDLRDEVRLGG